MTSEHFNFYLFSFHHKGGDTKWQTTLRCAECVAQCHELIEKRGSCTINISDYSDMYTDEVRVILIRCATLQEREDRLKMCTVMIETLIYQAIFGFTPTFAWRCAKTPEATVENTPQCLRIERRERNCFYDVFAWTNYGKF
jgi:hypothetical protein